MSSGIHTKKGTYRKANFALGMSAVGLIAAFPFQNAFWGGFITSGCSAALVGGLADWFAVNALFRRPLGVKPGRIFRTEIIPRNRERIYSALSDMVQNELLSQEALKNKFLSYDFSSPLLKIWEAGGRKRLEEPLLEFLQKFLPSLTVSVTDLEKELQQVLEAEEFPREELSSLMSKTLDSFSESEEGKKALKILMENISGWAQSSELHRWLVRWLEYSITRYVNDNPSRKFLTMFLPEPTVISTKLQGQLIDYLRSSAPIEGILSWAKEKSKELNQNQLFLNKILQTLLQTTKYALHKFVQNKLEAPKSALKSRDLILNQLETWAAKLKESPEECLKLNKQVQALLLPILENQHERIGKIVREGLERYTDEMLVELIESKAGEDLQMIRINGSVVGGLVGMIIFILNTFL